MEFLKAYKRTYIQGSKTAVSYYHHLYGLLITVGMNRTDAPRLIKDPFSFEAEAWMFPTRHFLLDIFDRKLQQYIEADLVNYNSREEHKLINPKRFEVRKESFSVLTLAELEAGFVVSMTPLLISILVFVIEWIPTLKNLVVFLIIFKKYFEMKNIEQTKHSESMKIKFEFWQAQILEKKQKELVEKPQICNQILKMLKSAIKRSENFQNLI